MGECRPVGRGQRLLPRVFLQVLDRTPEVVQHQVRHIAAEAVADEQAHHHHLSDVRQHRVGGRLPAAHAQPVREIEQRVARIAAVFDDPGNGGDALAAVTVEGQLEWAQLLDLPSNILRRVIGVLMDAPIAFPSQPQEKIILGNDLTPWA